MHRTSIRNPKENPQNEGKAVLHDKKSGNYCTYSILTFQSYKHTKYIICC